MYVWFALICLALRESSVATFSPLQQYIGAVMLILALFMVLFSNHMEERLQDGKSVLRVDCHMARPMVDDENPPDDKESLIPHGQVRGCIGLHGGFILLLCCRSPQPGLV